MVIGKILARAVEIQEEKFLTPGKWTYDMITFLVDVLLYMYTSGTTGYPKPAIVTHEK